MSYSKIHYHTGAPCNGCTGIGEYWRQLQAAGVPFGVYSVEGGGLIAEAAPYSHATLIYRSLATDVAAYHMTPEAAARDTWARLMAVLPPEVAALRGRVWLEIGNEQDKNRADWLGHYYAELAALALPAGHRICGPGWATGEPEPEHWRTPGWLRYLRLCAANPDRLAVTVHEYSLDADDLTAGTPWLVGRVKFLFDTCNAEGIAPPVIFVTECGWTHNAMPDAARAKADIAKLAALYSQYPTVRAAFLWSLMGGGDKKQLAADLNALMPWLADYNATARFPDPTPEPPPPSAVDLPIIDISHHQGRVNWDVFAPKVAAVIIRLGYGVTEDREARRNVLEAARRRVPFAVYHYWMPGVDPKAQGEWFGKLAREIAPGRLCAVDLEESSGTTADTTANAARARDYIRTLEAIVDHDPMVYTSLNYWRSTLGSPAWGIEYPLWIAAWTTATRPIVPAPFGDWTLWQYAVKDIDRTAWGVESYRLDFNRFNARWGTPDEFFSDDWYDYQQHPATLREVLLSKATEQAIFYHPAHALPAAAIRDGFYPVTKEFAAQHNGAMYTAILAANTATSRVYYAPGAQWDKIAWVSDGAGGPVAPPDTIDLLPYIRGEHRRQFDMGHNVNGGGTQTVQVYHLSPTDWLYIKGENGEYERLGLRTWNGEEWIFRFEDTSESPDRFYAHYLSKGGLIGAPWLPRHAKVGRWYETTKYVQHYLKENCTPQNSDTVTDRLQVASYPHQVVYAESLARLDGVITVVWGGGEQYDFARDRGNVAFRDGGRKFWFIGDLSGRADKAYRKPGCIPLGW